MFSSEIPRHPIAADNPVDPAEKPITIVTGLPRSGTSMMMRMLIAGGCHALMDDHRPADTNNPHGYFEYEPVTRLHRDTGWLANARGRVLKIVAPLLRHLPGATLDRRPVRYQMIFMRRDLDQVVASQLRMLVNRGCGNDAPAATVLLAAMRSEILAAERWIDLQGSAAIHIDYDATLESPLATASRLAAFIPLLDPAHAAAAVVVPPSGSP